MKLVLSLILLLIITLGHHAQTGSDRSLAGLLGNVRMIEYWSQSTEPNGKPAFELKKVSTDVYSTDGYLISSTFHEAGGRSIFSMSDGHRVSKYEQYGSVPNITAVPANGGVRSRLTLKKTSDIQYDHKYTYRFDKLGRIIEIDDHMNGNLYEKRTFTYDNAGRLASEIVIKQGRPSHGRLFKYDANGALTGSEGLFYLSSGERLVTPYQYSNVALDRNGNWIKRIVTKVDGANAVVISIETRKIKYY